MKIKSIQIFALAFLFIFIFSFSAPSPVSAAGSATVTGTVTDAFTGLPISGATVSASCTITTCSGSTTTNSSGNYTLRVSWGGLGGTRYPTIQASAAGHTSSQNSFLVSSGSSYPQDFSLNPIESTPPVITPTISGTLGNNGWYVSNVTITWAVTDGESAITSTSGCGNTTLNSNTNGTTRTCTATSGGGTTSQSVTVKVDKTAPTVIFTPTRLPDFSLWYNQPITFNITGSDLNSGVDSCTPQTSTYSGPDTGEFHITGSCTDKAGNASGVQTSVMGYRYDATGPMITFTPARPPDANGWYTAPITVTIRGTDATSGMALILDCTPVMGSNRTYSGPDNASASISGSCRDQAGNTTNSSFPLQYDTTGPTSASLAAYGTLGDNGWYTDDVTISTTGSDNVSPVTCTADQILSTDTLSQTFTGSCSNGAGMTLAAAPLTVKRDATAPVVSATPDRTADSNGWYTSGLTVHFSGTDATSGGVTCEADKSFSGPDTGSGSLSGSCTDAAGNSGSATYNFQFDANAPTGVSVSADRLPDSGGYYNAAFTATWTGFDGASGIASCTVTNYTGPDTESGSLSGACTDNAGLTSASVAFAFKYDATAPASVIATANLVPTNGYFNQPFTVTWTSADPADTCTSAAYSGPDTESGSLSGSCTDPAGNTTTVAFPFKYDATAPLAAANASPAANINGWNNSSVTVTFTGTDAGSGIDVCTDPIVLNINGRAQSASGSCTDMAGNISALATVSGINIDLVKPTITLSSRKPEANFWGWNNSAVTVYWTCSDSLSGVVSDTTADLVDTEGVLQVAEGECADKAGNLSSDKVGNINILFPEHYPIIPVTGDEDPVTTPEPVAPTQPEPTPTLTAEPSPEANNGIIPLTGGEETPPVAPQKEGGNGFFYVLGGIGGAGLLAWLLIFLAKRRKHA